MQGRGRRLTDRERLEIGEYARLHPQVKHVDLAAAYHVNESTIRKWRRESNACKVRARCASSGSDARRRGQAERAREFDLQLFNWICDCRGRGERRRPIQVRAKARELATTFEQMGNFKASSGWYYRFCRRFNLTLDGTGAAGDSNTASSNSSSDDAGAVDAESRGLEAATVSDLLSFDLLAPVEFSAGIESGRAGVGAAAQQQQVQQSETADPLQLKERATSCQATIARFLHDHAALLSRTSRMRFIKRLADVPDELDAFADMTSDARVQYAKSFAGSGHLDSVKQSSYVHQPTVVL
ncbi:Heat shock factor protein 2 [Phytophthora cinnamomi]|uniref:Heat shock factor protein 2 n=1 Tax=Phytophthora cinnamomi TaxID=4785 RepID=UPI003559EF5C|nr:Heat shock factor protein 2 [Phytophthora cinnamomi]